MEHPQTASQAQPKLPTLAYQTTAPNTVPRNSHKNPETCIGFEKTRLSSVAPRTLREREREHEVDNASIRVLWVYVRNSASLTESQLQDCLVKFIDRERGFSKISRQPPNYCRARLPEPEDEDDNRGLGLGRSLLWRDSGVVKESYNVDTSLL